MCVCVCVCMCVCVCVCKNTVMTHTEKSLPPCDVRIDVNLQSAGVGSSEFVLHSKGACNICCASKGGVLAIVAVAGLMLYIETGW